MLLIKTNPTTPKLRWKQYMKVEYKRIQLLKLFSIKTKNKKTLSGTKNIRGLKFFHERFLYNFYIVEPYKTIFTVLDINYRKHPIREFALSKNIFNNIALFINTNLMYPGFKIYPLKFLRNPLIKLINQIIPLKWISLNSIFSFVFNKKNTHMVFAKSYGCNCSKRKTSKKFKLAHIILPSGQNYILNQNVLCSFVKNENYFFNKIVEGGWGFTHKTKKLIHVRGVAKNPVDHPNGGRTKSKQTELSPWGWVAKHNK